MLGGILLSLLVAGAVRRLAGLVVFGIAAGALAALIMQTWFGLLQGDWLLNAAALGLGMSATAAFIIGMNAVFGRPGLGIAAIVTVLFANPISAAAVPMQFLPEPWGAIGQFFVPGAASNLLRSLSYFPDAATAMQWIVLACWFVGGVGARSRRALPRPARTCGCPRPSSRFRGRNRGNCSAHSRAGCLVDFPRGTGFAGRFATHLVAVRHRATDRRGPYRGAERFSRRS